MINTNRIVPVTQSDLLSLYGVSVALADDTVVAKGVANADVPAEFDIEDASGKFFLNEPAKKVALADGASVTLYMVAAYDFDGFYVGDTKLAAEVDNDGVSLLKAVVADGAVTVSKVGF